MNSIKNLYRGIKNDYNGYAKIANSRIKPIFKIHYYCNLIFRISHFFYEIKLLPLAKIFWGINRFVYAIDIDPGAKLNGGFVIIHGIGVVIGRYVISEGLFRIYQGATLGGNNDKESTYNGILLRQPYIKDNVIIGINAAVLGPVVIETGAVIGTNAVVTKNVVPNSIVVGNNKTLTSKAVNIKILSKAKAISKALESETLKEQHQWA
ncbi:MAG: CysE [Mucilaginibacter sp.]|nr:CysE [Mucilaginibacter sp.]